MHDSLPVVDSVGTSDVEYSLIQGASGAFFDKPGNINVDPKLTDTNRLMPDSPCIDAGTNILDIDPSMPGFDLLPPTDLDGNPRIAAGVDGGPAVVDMGAYEFQVPTNGSCCIDTTPPTCLDGQSEIFCTGTLLGQFGGAGSTCIDANTCP